jgi:hypothetical protein
MSELLHSQQFRPSLASELLGEVRMHGYSKVLW